MIRTLAIDDEPLALQQLENYIRKIPYMEFVAACQSASEAKKILEEEDIDVLFTDIHMPDLNGMEFVRSLVAPPLVVFTTAYSDYAVESFKLNVVDYLLKPFGLEDVERAAAKVKKLYDLSNAATVSAVDEDDALFLKTEYKIVRIDIDKICYIESMSEYLKIFVEDQPKPIIVLLSMKKIEERLPVSTFMRVHRSYIINLKKIQEVNKSRIIIDNEISIPVGDFYRSTFMGYLEKKFLGKWSGNESKK